MESHPLAASLKPTDLPLESIFLDPNNPRFTGPGWKYVPDSEIDHLAVQEDVQRRLIQDYEIEQLKMNMEVNGYLPIDRIVVRRFKKDQYVVLEGNRRICAAKMIAQVGHQGKSVSSEIVGTLKIIPCLVYTGTDPNAAWIFQGIRHITGIIEWAPYNKAKLLVDQMEDEGLSLTDVGRRFGLTGHGAGQWVRGYRAYLQAKEESDYTNEIDERAYTYFQELFSRSSFPVRDWIVWNETEMKFKDMLNLNEFVGWLYPRDDNGDKPEQVGDWNKRFIKTREDIRHIAELKVDAPDLFQQFRKTRDITRSYSAYITRQSQEDERKKYDPVEDTFSQIETCLKMLEDIPARVLRKNETKTRLVSALQRLRDLCGQLLDDAKEKI